MEIDLPLYSPSLCDLPPAFGAAAFRLPPGCICGDPDVDNADDDDDVCGAAAASAAVATASMVKTELEPCDDDFLKDILDLPDGLSLSSPADSGCQTGQSTPAHHCDFHGLGLSPPPTPLDEADEDDDEDDEDDEVGSSIGGPDSAIPGGLSDYELVSLSIKDLNSRLRSLPKQRVLQLKHRRRTLKNRQYAHVCRLRRQKSQAELATESVGMVRQIAALRHQLERVSRERDHYREEMRRLQLLPRTDGPYGGGL